MPGRKIRNEEEARNALEALAMSGLSRTAFARANGLDGRSLHCWERNLGRRGGSVRFVELIGEPMEVDRVYRLVIGDVTIEVTDDFDEDSLVRLVRVAQRC